MSGEGVGDTVLRVTKISKSFHLASVQVPAVSDVSIVANRGEFLTLLGPSGCGKTTTLRMIAGLETPDSGRIEIGDVPVFSSQSRVAVPIERRSISMVFQGYALWPHMSVRDNVEFPLRVKKVRGAARRKRAEEALELVGLGGYGDRAIGRLSGGQQQRVALARALVKQSDLLLLDEPLSNLDANLRRDLRTELTGLQRRLGLTTVFVTHDQAEALSMSTRIVLMSEGRVAETSTPEDLYRRPKSRFSADFVGEMDSWSGTVVDASADGTTIRVKTQAGVLECAGPFGAFPRDASVRVLVRPEHVRIRRMSDLEGSNQNCFHGVVEVAEFSGRQTKFTLRSADSRMIAVTHMPTNVREGDEVKCWFEPDHTWVQDDTGGTGA